MVPLTGEYIYQRQRVAAVLSLLGADVEALGWELAVDAAMDRAKESAAHRRHAIDAFYAESRRRLDAVDALTAANAKIAEIEAERDRNAASQNRLREITAENRRKERESIEAEWRKAGLAERDRADKAEAERDGANFRAAQAEQHRDALSRSVTALQERLSAATERAEKAERLAATLNNCNAVLVEPAEMRRVEAERDAAVRGREEAERECDDLRARNERQAMVILATREALGADEVDGIPRAIERLKNRNKTLSSDNKVYRRDVERLESQLAASEHARAELQYQVDSFRLSGFGIPTAPSAIRAQGAGVADEGKPKEHCSIRRAHGSCETCDRRERAKAAK